MSDSQDNLSIKAIKRRARKIRRASGISHSQALNRAAQQGGYQGFKHALNAPPRSSGLASADANSLPSAPAQTVPLDLSALEATIAVSPLFRGQQREDRREARVRSVLTRAQASLFMSVNLRHRRHFDTFFAEVFAIDFDILDDPRIKARARAIWAQVRSFYQAADSFEAMSAYEMAASGALRVAMNFDRRAEAALGMETALMRHEVELGVLKRTNAESATLKAHEVARRYEIGLSHLTPPISTVERAVESALRAQDLERHGTAFTATERLAAEARRADEPYRIAGLGF